MNVKNCPKCGGTHFGQYDCPMPPEQQKPPHRKITPEEIKAAYDGFTTCNAVGRRT